VHYSLNNLSSVSTKHENKYVELIFELESMGYKEYVSKFRENEEYFTIMTTDDYIASQTDKHPDGKFQSINP
jgi:hypothetical protein